MQALRDEQHEVRKGTQTIEEVAAAKDRVKQALQSSRALLEHAIDRMKERSSNLAEEADDDQFAENFEETLSIGQSPEPDIGEDPAQLLEGTATFQKDQDEEESNLDGGSPEIIYE